MSDDSEMCACCGFERGGIGDVECYCRAWAKALTAEVKYLRAEIDARRLLTERDVAAKVERLAAEDRKLRAEVARMQPVYEASIALRFYDRHSATERQRNLAMIRWWDAVDAAKGEP